MARIGPNSATQVVPDNWYIVLQKEPTTVYWRECGRLDVRNLPHSGGKISETWYLHTVEATSGGYPGGLRPRTVFRRLGSAGNEELDSVRLVRMSKRSGGEPTISHTKIVCICDAPIDVPLRAKRRKATPKPKRPRKR